ncbi:MAG: flagellar biosynthesis regulator FlaF [Magnetospirillum sp.]|nr:flagellar biosynthesis regulator FlaF [Magnetospirillum sp.]
MSFGKQVPGYSKLPSGGCPADTEAWALIQCARQLFEAQTAADPQTAVKDALNLNMRLWSIFQAELTAPHCTTPEDIRANMLTLCQFVHKHSVATMLDGTPDKIKVLIDLDRNIAAGLLAGKENAAAEQAAALVPASIDIVG